jgi:hypothetical protein
VADHLRQPAPQNPLYIHVEVEPGGGKSYLLNVLLALCQSIGHIALPSAFLAKVARKFQGGQTAHHWFGLAPSRVGGKIEVHVERPAFDEAADTKVQHNGRRLQNARL